MQALDRKQNTLKDQVSHFVLRLAYCRTEELRRWFLAHESELFKARFNSEDAASKVNQLAGGVCQAHSHRHKGSCSAPD